MGPTASLLLNPVKPGFSTMSVTFQCSDRITVLHLDDAGLSVIRQAIYEACPSCIKMEQTRCGSGWSFKLVGYPFGILGLKQSNQLSRKIVCQIFQRLYGIGWKVIGCSILGRHDYRNTFFFEKISPQFSTRPFIAVCLKHSDTLQLFNVPGDLIKPIKDAINSSWSLGIQKEDLVDGVFEIKLSGTPWVSKEKQSVMAKRLLQSIIAALHYKQWGYYCSVSFEFDLHSLIFHYDENITYGESLSLCTISLKRSDRLRLIHASEETIAMVRNVINIHWQPGIIQEERAYHGSWEFKLSGTPWYSKNDESVRARYLVAKILEAMQEHGWQNIAGFNCSRRFSDKTVMIFQETNPRPSSPVICLSLNDTDKVKCVNMPPEIVELVKDTVLSRWSKGVQDEKQIVLESGTVSQLKLSGNPWIGGFNDDTIHGASLLCNLIDDFRQRGWKLLLCGDISSKYFDDENKIPMDPYSLWFIYNPSVGGDQIAPTFDVNFTSFAAHTNRSVLNYSPGFGYQLSVFDMQPPPTYEQATLIAGQNEKA